jgi:tetratricopeptide (TPR) repeat protein
MSLRDLVTDVSCAPDGGASSAGASSGPPPNALGALARAALDAPPGLADAHGRDPIPFLGAGPGMDGYGRVFGDPRALLLQEAPPAHRAAAAAAAAATAAGPRSGVTAPDIVDEFLSAHPSAARHAQTRPPLPLPPHGLPPFFPHVVGAPYARIAPPSPAAATAVFEAAFAAGAGAGGAVGVGPARSRERDRVGSASNSLHGNHLYNNRTSYLPQHGPTMWAYGMRQATAAAQAASVGFPAGPNFPAERNFATAYENGPVAAPPDKHDQTMAMEHGRDATGSLQERARERVRESFPDADSEYVDAQINDLMRTLEQLRAYPVVPDESAEAAARDWEREFAGISLRDRGSASGEARSSPTRTIQFANAMAELDGSSSWADEAQLTSLVELDAYANEPDATTRSPSWSHEFTSFDGGNAASVNENAASSASASHYATGLGVGNAVLENPDLQEHEHAFSDTFQADLCDFLGRDPGAIEYEFMADNLFRSLSANQAMEEGMRLRNNGQLSLAAQAFESAVSSNKLKENESARGWYLLGSTHAECDDDQRAIQAFLRCVRCYGRGMSTSPGYVARLAPSQEESEPPFLTDALLALGVSYTNELNVPKALAHLSEWLDVRRQIASPSSDPVSQMDMDDVESSRQRSYGLASGSFVADELSQTEHSQLVRRMERIARDNPADVDVRIALGILYNLSRQYDLAAEALRMAVTLRPDDARLWNKLGATLANGNESDDALRAYRKAVDLAPNFIRAWVNVGTAYANRSSFDKAARYYLKALSMYAAKEREKKNEDRNTGPADSPLLGDSDMVHVWGYLRTTLVALQREDLLPLVDVGSVEEFRPYIAF